ncbi:MAG: hypothetical protein WBG73_15310 [Coleofasciculaceae cyanobacterium]
MTKRTQLSFFGELLAFHNASRVSLPKFLVSLLSGKVYGYSSFHTTDLFWHEINALV